MSLSASSVPDRYLQNNQRDDMKILVNIAENHVLQPRQKKRHENTCKYKDDIVRNLELELDIDVHYEYSKNTCRFCGKTMRVDHLLRHESACKAKTYTKQN